MYKRIFLILLIGTIAIFFTSHLMRVVFAQTTNISTSNPHSWDDGLVGYWSFDGQYTTTTLGTSAGTRDVSGNGNWGWFGGGTASAVPTPVAGISGQALSFDGVDDYVNCGNNASLQITGAITLEAWVKMNDSGLHKSIITKDTSTSRGVNLNIRGSGTYDNKFAFIIASSPTARTVRYSSSNVPFGIWTHIVGVYNPSTNQDVYVNGVLQNGDIDATIPAALNNSTQNLFIGNSGWSEFGNGLIDEVRIYNRALSADEVKQHYEQTRRKFVVSSSNPHQWTDGLVGYWSFDGQYTTTTSGTSAGTRDVSNNGNWGWFGGGTASAVPTPAAGISGQALSFDGVDDYVDVPLFNGTEYGNLTFEFWAKTDVLPVTSLKYILDNSPGATGYIIRIDTTNSGNKMYAYVYTTSGLKTTYLTVPDKNWHFYAVEITPTFIGISIDGGSFIKTTYLEDTIAASGDTLNIGSDVGFAGEWDGLIDEVRVYNRALSADEVKQHYEQTRRKLGI